MSRAKWIGIGFVWLMVVVFGAVADDAALPGSERIFANRWLALEASSLDRDLVIVSTPLGTRDGVTLYQLATADSSDVFYALVETGKEEPVALALVDGVEIVLPEDGEAQDFTHGASVLPAAKASWCQVDGGFDDTLSRTRCCSGVAVSGSTVCVNAADFGTTWRSCSHVCGSRSAGTQLIGGCIPSGGVDDTLSRTRCCSNAAVSGSTRCLNPADFGTTWRSCIHTCR